MIPDKLIAFSTAALLTFGQVNSAYIPTQPVLASHEISLDNRYPVKSVSDVFQDNILLNLAYMRGLVQTKSNITWEEVKKPFHYEFKLEPNKTFAFHDDILPEYKDSLVKTTQAHFNGQEGFKTDGYLFGDGVCHLASLIYWVAKDAGLEAKAPTSHDFMAIPEIDRKFGVSVYANPYTKSSNAQQNLYVTNNKSKAITMVFDYDGSKLKTSIVEDN